MAIIEAQDRILPLYDEALTAPVRAWLKKAGVNLHLGSRASQFGDGILTIESDAGTVALDADPLLIAAGRRPNAQGWGLQAMGVDLDGSFIRIDDQCRTSIKGVNAIGDLVGEPMLEHKAAAQGRLVAEVLSGRPRRFDPVSIAAVCFTEPEIVSAGLTPMDAKALGDDVGTAAFPFQANGRALSMEAGEDGGFVLKSDRRVLGLRRSVNRSPNCRLSSPLRSRWGRRSRTLPDDPRSPYLE